MVLSNSEWFWSDSDQFWAVLSGSDQILSSSEQFWAVLIRFWAVLSGSERFWSELLGDRKVLGVMNHIPLHPFAIKSHPNPIPSLPNLPPMFPPFLSFPDTPLLRRSVTRHSSPITSSLRHSVVIILHYQFPLLPSFVLSDLFRPY